MLNSAVTGVAWAVSLASLLVAVAADFRHRIVPNQAVFLIACCGVAIRLSSDPNSLLPSIGVSVVTLLVLGLLAHRTVIGGGDAKLIAAVTLLFQPAESAQLFLGIALAGGLLSAAYLATHLIRRHHNGRNLGKRDRLRHLPAGAALRLETAAISAHKSVPYSIAVFGAAGYLASTKAMLWLHATF